MWKVITSLLCLMLLATPVTSDTDDDFVPKDIDKAVAIGCGIYGTKGSPPYAEAQVFVKYGADNGKVWDFEPILARHEINPDGVYRAIDDCREWLAKVKASIGKPVASKQSP